MTLDGNDDYVNLPNGLISSLDSMSIVAWISTRDDTIFGRVFDFGNSNAGEDQRSTGKTFLMMTAYSNTGDGKELTMQAKSLGSESSKLQPTTRSAMAPHTRWRSCFGAQWASSFTWMACSSERGRPG